MMVGMVGNSEDMFSRDGAYFVLKPYIPEPLGNQQYILHIELSKIDVFILPLTDMFLHTMHI